MNRRLWLAVLAAGALSSCASMMPPKSIVDTAASNPNLSTLTRLINDAGLADTLRGPGPFTVFAPSDEAFKKMPKATMDSLAKDKKQLVAVLSYHVVGGEMTSADIKAGNIKTVGGSELPISRTGNFIGVDQALVTQADVKAANGVIHVIDEVLLPPRR
jgi:uncharacterized surface protein with fasciclin (FAS1) repeats